MPRRIPETPWQVGQRAVIDRRLVVVIERVTPSGRAVISGRTFGADGYERARGSKFRRSKLEAMTSEIEAEMDLAARSSQASRDAREAIEAAEKWLRQFSSPWGRNVPDAADVDKAERLAVVIREALSVAKEDS